MLQNPSKYHMNPLSHFLALHHSTQMMHNTRATPVLPTTHADNSNHYNYHQNHHQHQQQQQQQQQHQHTQINAYQSPQTSTSPFDSSSSSLDAGKSFTIAAILGLQKSAIENNRKEYNNSVINLSMNDTLNCENNDNDKHNNNNNNISTINNNNNNNHKLNRMECINRFDTDKMALMNRFLPASANQNQINVQQQQHQQQVCANNFVAAAAVAAAAAANAAANGNSAPTALQSLQQLHQHHAQQNTLSTFHRDKPKEISKRSSLKNKRVRTIFTPEQLERLEAEFERQQYMVGPERLYLAHTLQLTEAQVKVWFQNRRIKWRKHHLEITHQRLALMRQTQVPATTNSTLETDNGCGSLVADESDEVKYIDDIKQLGESRQASESDLSICNESLDNDSAFDCGEDT